MKRSYSSILSVLFILGFLAFTFFTMMPQWKSDDDAPLAEFSTKRALAQVKNISQNPHFVGSENHDLVANYLVKELQNMGLETSIQEGFAFSGWGTLTKCKNILAKIKGTNSDKALLLLSHYDSAPHSYSRGASDAASGVATILESVRAFTYTKKQHKNDIIILFSDAEELGLNGAALFVTQHNWAKEVGLVLNFEARGSSGPSYMLMETNGGNARLVKEFSAADVKYPVSCLRLNEKDAKQLYEWADQWVLVDDENVKFKGTPVLIFGSYPFGKPKPWLQLVENPKALTISESEMEKITIPYFERTGKKKEGLL